MYTLINHILLLMTFRHNGEGLDLTSRGRTAIILGLSAFAATLRWGDPMLGLIHLAILCAIMWVAPTTYIVGYALLSLGIDIVAIPMGHFGVQNDVFRAWEFIGVTALVVRLVRAKRWEKG